MSISSKFVYSIFIITILNNLLQLEDYFQQKAASMRRDINDHKTPHPLVGLVRYCKILVTLDMQSAHLEAALHNYRNRTYPYLF